MYQKPIHLDNYGVNTPKGLIGSALRARTENVNYELCEPGDEEAFFVADLGEVYRQHMRWKKNLPRVKPFYGRLDAELIQDSANNASCQVQPGQRSHPFAR